MLLFIKFHMLKVQKSPISAHAGTATVVAQARLRLGSGLARVYVINSQKSPISATGGTPNVVAQFKHVVSLGIPIRSNGLQQLVVCYFTLPIRSNGLQQLWVTRFSLLDIFFSLVECPPFLYLLSHTIILVL